MGTQTYTTPGANLWTCPLGVVLVDVDDYGAGGGGKGADASNSGGGGAGGDFSKKLSVSVTPGNVYSAFVGAGGSAGSANGGSGGIGGDSYFIDPSIVLAKGGLGATSTTGAVGGRTSSGVGDTKFGGGTGGNGLSATGGAGGGSSAGITSNGNTGDNGSSVGGNGAFPPTGSAGSGGHGGAISTNAGLTAGTQPGGGGGGGAPSNLPGAAGGAGMITLTWADPMVSSTTAVSIDDVIEKARKITGNVSDTAVGETMIPSDAIELDLEPTIRDLNEVLGGSTSQKEIVFATIPLVQDYAISTYVGADVFQITDVIRSGAYVPANVIAPSDIDPTSGLPWYGQGGGAVSVGLQGQAMDAIVNSMRFSWNDRFGWEIVNSTVLRLFPFPLYNEVVAVRYVVNGFSITSLPTRCTAVLVYAACVSILNGILNRIMSDRATTTTYGAAKTERLRILSAQRDYYELKRVDEFRKLG